MHGDDPLADTVLQMKVARGIDCKSAHGKKNNFVTVHDGC